MAKKGAKHSPETRAKIGAALRKRFADPAERERMSAERKQYLEDHPEMREEMAARIRRWNQEHPEARVGREHTAATRRKLSESLTQWYLEEWFAKLASTNAPTRKRCAKCETIKPLEEFHVEKYKTKSGLISTWPASYCKKCRNREVRERRKRKLKEDPKGTREREREYKRRYAARYPGRQNEQQRQSRYQRAQKEGRAIQPRKQIRKWSDERKRVPIEPAHVLVTVLRGMGYSLKELAERSGVQERRLSDIEHMRSAQTHIDNVDRLLIAFDRQDDLQEMYPLEEPEPLVGYNVLDPEGVLGK